jgi:hypothetical protein
MQTASIDNKKQKSGLLTNAPQNPYNSNRVVFSIRENGE